MATHVLDLNAFERRTLELTLTDEKRTVIHLTVPDVDTVQKVQAALPVLSRFKSGNLGDLKTVYEVTAEIMSCNEEGMTFTAEDLSIGGKYNLHLEALVVIFSAYTDFITDIASAKN